MSQSSSPDRMVARPASGASSAMPYTRKSSGMAPSAARPMPPPPARMTAVASQANSSPATARSATSPRPELSSAPAVDGCQRTSGAPMVSSGPPGRRCQLSRRNGTLASRRVYSTTTGWSPADKFGCASAPISRLSSSHTLVGPFASSTSRRSPWDGASSQPRQRTLNGS